MVAPYWPSELTLLVIQISLKKRSFFLKGRAQSGTHAQTSGTSSSGPWKGTIANLKAELAVSLCAMMVLSSIV